MLGGFILSILVMKEAKPLRNTFVTGLQVQQAL